MTIHRIIKGVLGNFLGSYTSRYSDYHGYWLFGFLVPDINEVEFNLLAPKTEASDVPLGIASTLAKEKFKEQISKSRLELSRIRNASLRITKMPGEVIGLVNFHSCTGFNVRFQADAVMDNDKKYESKKLIFVAPHDAKVERRNCNMQMEMPQ